MTVSCCVLTDSTAAVIDLGRLALAFGRVDRTTYHEDGVTPESDTDHTVMLALVGCAFAARYLPRLDVGLVAQYALVHDVVEVYAGDTPTLHALTKRAKTAKNAREFKALGRIQREFGDTFPWLHKTIASYERRLCAEARYVKAMDKLLPTITRLLNGRTELEPGQVVKHYDRQLVELQAYASDFPELFELRAELVDLCLAAFTHVQEPVA